MVESCGASWKSIGLPQPSLVRGSYPTPPLAKRLNELRSIG
jgi:hypothetical protein